MVLKLKRGFSKQNLIKTKNNYPRFETKKTIGNSNFNKYYFEKLTCEGLLLVKNGIFPTQKSNFRVKLKNKINEFLTIVAQLSDSNNINKALKLIEKYVFNFCIRLYIIHLFKERQLKDPFTKNVRVITNKKALKFLTITQLKNIHKLTSSKIPIIRRENKKESIKKIVSSSLLEIMLQKQFKLLLDPCIDAKLYKSQFRYKKSKSASCLIIQLHYYLIKAFPQTLNILKINFNKYFDNLSHMKILKSSLWPKRFEKFLIKWLTPKIYAKDLSNFKLKKILIQRKVLKPLIYKFILNDCLKKTTTNYNSNIK